MDRAGAEISLSHHNTSQLDVISERLRRALLNLTRTLLIESELENSWFEALFYSLPALG